MFHDVLTSEKFCLFWSLQVVLGCLRTLSHYNELYRLKPRSATVPRLTRTPHQRRADRFTNTCHRHRTGVHPDDHWRHYKASQNQPGTNWGNQTACSHTSRNRLKRKTNQSRGGEGGGVNVRGQNRPTNRTAKRSGVYDYFKVRYLIFSYSFLRKGPYLCCNLLMLNWKWLVMIEL